VSVGSCTHGEAYLFSAPGEDELHCGVCLLVENERLRSLACSHAAGSAHNESCCLVKGLERDLDAARAESAEAFAEYLDQFEEAGVCYEAKEQLEMFRAALAGKEND